MVVFLNSGSFKKGKMVVYERRYEEFEWVIFIQDIGTTKKEILVKNTTSTFNKIQVFNRSLLYYPDVENIAQTSEKNYRLTKESLIEVYQFQ